MQRRCGTQVEALQSRLSTANSHGKPTDGEETNTPFAWLHARRAVLAPTAAADAARRTAVEAGPMLRCIVRCVGLLRGVARDRTGLPVRDGRGGKGATAVPALLPALHVPAGLPTAEEDLQRLLIDAKVGDHMRAAAALAAVLFRSLPYDGALRATALQRKPP
jgi:hypothetical protein